jgi:hypothetical protein
MSERPKREPSGLYSGAPLLNQPAKAGTLEPACSISVNQARGFPDAAKPTLFTFTRSISSSWK